MGHVVDVPHRGVDEFVPLVEPPLFVRARDRARVFDVGHAPHVVITEARHVDLACSNDGCGFGIGLCGRERGTWGVLPLGLRYVPRT